MCESKVAHTLLSAVPKRNTSSRRANTARVNKYSNTAHLQYAAHPSHKHTFNNHANFDAFGESTMWTAFTTRLVDGTITTARTCVMLQETGVVGK